ncbi:MAG TPA: ATP-binding protein [Bacteroidales bacterium]|jgi:predicted AAA+ superfamily ATPase|nr:ATP-binding protein [Bacteroidales bacterium]
MEQKILLRKLGPIIEKAMVPQRVVLIFGARRVGKTILLESILKQVKGNVMLLNGDDADTLRLLEERSISNYRRLLNGVDVLAIDEAQQIPEIGHKLKLIVDTLQDIRVIATGSSSFDLLNKSGEPLVGRARQFLLTPFSQLELSQEENLLETRRALPDRLIYGAYPDVVKMGNDTDRQNYLEQMAEGYLLKDILELDGIRNSAGLVNLLKLIAHQVGNEVSYDELGKQTGLSRNTVIRYLDLLSKVYIIYSLSGYSGNMRKEVTKSRKWYFYDNGIRNVLTGDFRPEALRSDMGALWENYMVSERVKNSLNKDGLEKFYFWRTYDKQEIDLIETSPDGSVRAFEFKWGNKKPRVPKSFATSYPHATFQAVNPDNYHDFLQL